jgi:beta-fructofuranosidase
MKKHLSHYFLMVLTPLCLLLFTGCAKKQEPSRLVLQSTPWLFQQSALPLATLTTENTTGSFNAPGDSTGFSIKLTASLKPENTDRTILEIPGVIDLKLYQHDVKKRAHQNFPAKPMPDASVPVLEAYLQLHSPFNDKSPRNMTIGIPLAVLENPYGQHEIVLHFTGARFTLYVDNELLDNDFPIGYPKWSQQSTWKIDPERTSKAEIFFPGIEPRKVELKTPRIAHEIQYWTPNWHNAWVGDVASFFHEGRYHIFYLFDRRWHTGKLGRGGHYFEHISTTDFKTWTEHQAATPVEEQWETFGTGTPFLHNGKLALSYGLHTTRIYPKEQTTLGIQWDYLNKHGETGAFKYDTIPLKPAGSSYSVSEDGISNFKKTKILFHPCENPSIYHDKQGRLRMLANYGAKGTWESKSVDGGWKAINPNFPLGGDCTFYFNWGNFDYIIGGFTNFWYKSTAAPEDKYEDGVKAGFDFYNGMSAPAVTEINDGRFLLAGWTYLHGWGGTLAIHELVQSPDGILGTKWMEEIVPVTGNEKVLAKAIEPQATFETNSSSFLLSFDVDPGTDLTGKLGTLLLGANGDEKACEIQISPNNKRAQYSEGGTGQFAGSEKSIREGGNPSSSHNFAIENLQATDKPFKVRMVVKYDQKFGGSLIDTEIAGKRTMISFRPDLKVNKILMKLHHTTIKNLKIAPLKY